jgi:hypothetical protein
MTDDVAAQMRFLTQFRADIIAHYHGASDATVRSRINKGLSRARQLVSDAGELKIVALSPPPAVGGTAIPRADPFNFILEAYYGMTLIPQVADMIEAAIGVLEDPEFMKRRSEQLKQRSKQTAVTANEPVVREPVLPDKVTLSWLVKHVPVSFWLWFVGLLAAAFVAGAKWGSLLKPS